MAAANRQAKARATPANPEEEKKPALEVKAQATGVRSVLILKSSQHASDAK